MKLIRNEKKNLLILSGGIIFYLIILILLKENPILFNYTDFLFMHIVLELASIIISASIAIQSWIVFSYKQYQDRLLYFSGFTLIAVFDLFHLLTYNGMPGSMVIDSSANNATWFWILARFTQAIFMVYILHAKVKTVSFAKKRVYFLNTLLTIFVIIGTFSYLQNKLPVLVIEGQGTTTLKNFLEYVISFLLFISIIKLAIMYKQFRKSVTLHFIVAVTFLLLSELIFTLYKSVYDSLNLLGHVYKVLGFLFFMRVLYLSTVKDPFEKLIYIRRKLEMNEKRLKTITASLGEGVFVINQHRHLTFINREGERLLGYQAHELLGKEIHSLIHGSKSGDNLHVSECPICKGVESKEAIRIDEDIFIHKSGRTFPVSYVVTPLIENNTIVGSVVVFQDISKQQEYLNRIKHQAYHHILTDLPNRLYFLEKLDEKIIKSDFNNEFALILLDIDDFKNINDSYGHKIGDIVLIEIARMLSSFYHHTFIAHMSSDEFAILMDGNKEEIREQAENIINHLHTSIPIEHNEVFLSISIGICLFPYDGVNSEKLIQMADISLSEAKRLGKNRYIFYNDDLEYRRVRKNWIEQHLNNALFNNEITVHYQPIVNAKTKAIIGLEALARWYHPKEGAISPQEFIDVAESNGLIIPIGTYIVQMACQDLAELNKRGFENLFVSINLSLKQLKHPDFMPAVDQILQAYGLNAKQIQFEITETVTLQEDSDLIKTIGELKNKQFRIAIDDFGKGFSSIGYLKHISVDTLKIDKSYVFNVLTDEKLAKLTNAIIIMGQLLHLDIVVEGVETKEHLAFINRFSNILAQGYYFSRPLPLEEFIESSINRN